jgi:uncharacterized protein (TIGR00369 family)
MTEAMNGLEQLRAFMARNERAPIADRLDFDLVEVSDGRAVFKATPGMHVYNPIGSVHGGYAATIMDSACGCAVHSKLSPTQGYTTLELKIAYHRALTSQTGEIRVEGSVLSFGRRVAFAEARLLDRDGRLCVSASSTLLVFEKPS